MSGCVTTKKRIVTACHEACSCSSHWMSSVGPLFRGSIRPPGGTRWNVDGYMQPHFWLVVKPPICKNMAQIGFIFPKLEVEWKIISNHHLVFHLFSNLPLLVLGRATSFDHSYWDSIVSMEGRVLGQEDGEQVGWQEKSDCRKTTLDLVKHDFLEFPHCHPPAPRKRGLTMGTIQGPWGLILFNRGMAFRGIPLNSKKNVGLKKREKIEWTWNQSFRHRSTTLALSHS